MPTYEYRCTQCEAPLEVVQSIHEQALTECPACGGRLRKVFGNVGVVFKGSGFYRTDSRGKSSATAPAKPDAAGKPAAAASGDGAAAKPAAAAAAASATPASSSGSASGGSSASS
jgi:putative FmdB family regulatory protein